MKANPQQLRETLRLTKEFLNVRSESDLEYALEWAGKITGCDSMLAINFTCNPEHSTLKTNATYHQERSQSKCDAEVILNNPLFSVAKSAFSSNSNTSQLCLPPCGGVGAMLGERNDNTNSVTSLLLVTHDQNALHIGYEISEFLLPHIDNAIQNYTQSDIKTKESHTKILSTRELDVLSWIGAGKSNWETAMILGISENTVKFHVSNICKKLNVRRRGHAIAKAIQLNLINI